MCKSEEIQEKREKEMGGGGGGGGGEGGVNDEVMPQRELASTQLETSCVQNSTCAFKMPPNSQMESGSNDCVQLVLRHKRSPKRSRSNSPIVEKEKKRATAARVLAAPVPVVVNFEEAPAFLQFNQYIYRGYRTNLCTVTCLKRSFPTRFLFNLILYIYISIFDSLCSIIFCYVKDSPLDEHD